MNQELERFEAALSGLIHFFNHIQFENEQQIVPVRKRLNACVKRLSSLAETLEPEQ